MLASQIQKSTHPLVLLDFLRSASPVQFYHLKLQQVQLLQVVAADLYATQPPSAGDRKLETVLTMLEIRRKQAESQVKQQAISLEQPKIICRSKHSNHSDQSSKLLAYYLVACVGGLLRFFKFQLASKDQVEKQTLTKDIWLGAIIWGLVTIIVIMFYKNRVSPLKDRLKIYLSHYFCVFLTSVDIHENNYEHFSIKRKQIKIKTVFCESVNFFIPAQIFDIQSFMKSQLNSNFQKKIKDYVISYCPSEYFGKNIHGQMRTGYRSKQNKIVIFRIVPLPLTPLLTQFLQIQRHYSQLSGYARIVFDPLHSSSNHYLPLEYFPRTFNTETNVFKSNPKYMDEFVQKFLRVYAFFYNMRVTHGNLTSHNIGITFEGKVKLMDFIVQDQHQKFQEKALKDFHDFKAIIGIILEKDDHFPAKFSSFNSPQNHNWEHLFSSWHVTSPLQPVYLLRKGYVDNIVTVLHKLYQSLQEVEQSQQLRVGLRLLMMNYLSSSKEEDHSRQLDALQEIMGNLSDWDCQRFNGIMIGAIKDPEYYGISSSQRLVLISSLITKLNHQYIYYEIVNEFNSEQKKRNHLLGDSLYIVYRYDIFMNLLKANH